MSDMMTVRLDAEMTERFHQLAEYTSRSESNMVEDALREYLFVNESQIKAIQKGIKQADEGQWISHDELRAKWEKKLAGKMD